MEGVNGFHGTLLAMCTEGCCDHVACRSARLVWPALSLLSHANHRPVPRRLNFGFRAQPNQKPWLCARTMIRRARCSQRWCRTATAALLLVCGLTYGALLRYYIARRGPSPFESIIVDEASTRMSTIVAAESPAPRPPNQTAAKLVVDLYESAGCSGQMISVAQESSEMNCARCFDFCTKDCPGGGQVSGNAKSLRVRGGPGAVGLYGDCSGHWNYIDPHFQTFAMVADGCVKIVGTRPVSHLRFYPASAERQPPPLWAASVAREGVHDEAVILRRLRYWESEADVSRSVACCTLFLAALLGACVAVCAFIWKSDRWCQHSAASTPICFRRSSCPTAVEPRPNQADRERPSPTDLCCSTSTAAVRPTDHSILNQSRSVVRPACLAQQRIDISQQCSAVQCVAPLSFGQFSAISLGHSLRRSFRATQPTHRRQ